MSGEQQTEVAIRPWSDGDLPLLERLRGDPAMTEHLGGPEAAETIRERHQRCNDWRLDLFAEASEATSA